jgi:DHA1 family multidrug resistance protein-like MFS transporter
MSWIFLILFKTVEFYYIGMIVRGPLNLLQGSCMSFIADIYPTEQRGKKMGIWQGVMGIGTAIGPVSMGLIISSYSYEGYFLVASIIAACSIFIVILLVKESKPKTEVFTLRERQPQTDNPKFKGEKRNIALFFTGRLGDMGRGMAESLLGVYLLSKGIGVTELGLITSVAVIAQILSGPVFGRISDKFGRKWLLIAGQALLGLGILMYTQVGSFSDALALRIMNMTFVTLAMVCANAFLADLMPTQSRGMGFGIYHSLVSFDTAGGSIIGGYIANSYGWPTFFITGAAMLLSGAGILCISKEPKKNKLSSNF